MKKFLIILLIAIVACSTVSTVEEEEFDLEKINLPNWIKNGWSKIKETVKKVVQFLKDTGLWASILNFVKKQAIAAANKLCNKHFENGFCVELINNAQNIISAVTKK